jgi:hypothetical protein
MQPEGCLNKAKVIGSEIADDTWKPGLVFKFEKMKTRKVHRASDTEIYLDSLGEGLNNTLTKTV